MADVPYSEDIVKNSHGVLGLVLQDGEETSEESDSEDEILKKGQILVCWYPSGEEETLSTSKVQLADRSLLPGDCVKLADSTQSKQKGFVSDVEVFASVKVLAAGQVVRNIDCRELHPLQDLIPGVHVSLGPWLGMVTESQPKLILKMKNGSRCSLEGEQTEVLFDMSDQRDEESPFYSETFYPGQVVGGPSRVFKEAKWLSGAKPIMHNQAQVKATVEEASIVSCEVNWQVCGACSPGEESSILLPPPPTVTGEELQRLHVINHYRHSSIQIGDKAYYTVKESDLQMIANTLGYNPSNPPNDDHTSKQPQNPVDGSTPMDEQTQTWNDNKKGTHDESGPTGTLSDSTDEDTLESTGPGDSGDHGAHKNKGTSSQGTKHDSSSGPSTVRFPARSRRRKRAKRKRKVMQHLQVNVGDRVCVEVTSTCTTVNVVWQDRTTSSTIPSTHLTPVLHLDEHEFFPGDYVSDKRVTADSSIYGNILTTNSDARTCDVKWFTREGLELSTERDVSVYDVTEHTDFVFNAGDVVVRMVPPDYCMSPMATTSSSACVGQVISVDENGRVFTRWVDGTSSYVIPQELFKVDTEDDDQSADMSEHGSHGNSDDEWETASDDSSEEVSHDQDINIIVPPTAANNHNSNASVEIVESSQERDDGEKVDYNIINEMLSNRNPAFMILGTTPDEHYFKLFPFLPPNQRKVMMVIQKELSLLHSSLPSGILVRSFEDRVDLYRVMITGPTGTPYEHGLFLFDVRLTPNYPNTPPQFHYLSMCSGRLNPNLYEDGKVCVSLLGTWPGKDNEVWTNKSSILQVLISIQGLILNSEPYYNEAGYEKQRGTQEGLDNSRLYNEMAILKLLQSMSKMISRPPVGFEKEILQHFAEHVPILLRKIKFWLAQNIEATNSVEEQKPPEIGEATNQINDPNISATEGIAKEQKPINQQNTQPHPENGIESEDKSPDGQENQVQGATAVACSQNCQQISVVSSACSNTLKLPDYPLFPLSKGFRKSLQSCVQHLRKAMEEHSLGGYLPADS